MSERTNNRLHHQPRVASHDVNLFEFKHTLLHHGSYKVTFVAIAL